MRGRQAKPDALFVKDKFFQVAVIPPEEIVTLSFPLPESPETMHQFLTTYGAIYRKGITEIVNQLRNWCEAQHMLSQQANNNLDSFLTRFDYSGLNPEMNEEFFSLFSNGVYNLATIVHLLNVGKKSITAKRAIIGNLIPEMNVCGPGVADFIKVARERMSANLAVELMCHRRQIAGNVALSVIKEFFSEEDLDEVWEVHYANTLLDSCAPQLGLSRSVDFSATVDFSEEVIESFLKQTLIQLNPSEIIDAILSNAEYWQKDPQFLRSKHYDHINHWLLNHGDDPGFDFRLLIYNDETDEFIKLADLDYRLMHSIFKRLIGDGWIDTSQIKRKVVPEHPTVEVYIPSGPNIKLAYLAVNREKTALIPWIVQLFLSGKSYKWINRLCTVSQKKELHDAVAVLAYKEICQQFENTPHTLNDMKNILIRFDDDFPDHYPLLLRLMTFVKKDIHRDFIYQFKLEKRIRTDLSLENSALYIALFPAKTWKDVFDRIDSLNPLIGSPDTFSEMSFSYLELLATLNGDTPLFDRIEEIDLLKNILLNAHDISEYISEMRAKFSSLVNPENLILILKHYSFTGIVIDNLEKLCNLSENLSDRFLTNSVFKLLFEYSNRDISIVDFIYHLEYMSPSLVTAENISYLVNLAEQDVTINFGPLHEAIKIMDPHLRENITHAWFKRIIESENPKEETKALNREYYAEISRSMLQAPLQSGVFSQAPPSPIKKDDKGTKRKRDDAEEGDIQKSSSPKKPRKGGND